MARNEYAFAEFMNEAAQMTREAVAQIAAAEVARSTTPAPKRVIERPDKALDCPKCAANSRAGFLLEADV